MSDKPISLPPSTRAAIEAGPQDADYAAFNSRPGTLAQQFATRIALLCQRETAERCAGIAMDSDLDRWEVAQAIRAEFGIDIKETR